MKEKALFEQLNSLYKKERYSHRPAGNIPPLVWSSERCRVEMSKLRCAAMQMDFSLPCWKGGQTGNIASIFSLSLSRFSFFCEGLSCLGSLKSKCMIIIPPLFIATLYRILTAWQFHIGWNSWPHHIAEIDLACCDFLRLLKSKLIFSVWWIRHAEFFFYPLFHLMWWSFIWCCNNKQWNITKAAAQNYISNSKF